MLDTQQVPTLSEKDARDYVNDVFGKYCTVRPAPKTREDFLKSRRDGMGGSDSAIIAGTTPKTWGSLLSLYASKVSDEPEKRRDTTIMDIGNALEDFVIDKAVQKIAQEYQAEATLVTRSLYLASKGHPNVLASLDATVDVAGVPMIVDAKTTRDYDEDVLRPNYWTQLLHYMGITGISRACLATLDVVDGKLHTRYITMTEDASMAWGMILDGDLKFWKDHVVARRAPPADPEYAMVDQEALYRLYPRHVPGKIVRLDDEFSHKYKRYEQLASEIKMLSQEQEALKLVITEAIGDAEYGYLMNGDAFTYRTTDRKGYFVEPSTYRMLRLTTMEAAEKARQKAAKGTPTAKRKRKAEDDDAV